MTLQADSGNSKIQDSQPIRLKEHIVEFVSDSGEGAQKAGQSFGAISAKMGNGVWTVEIIPAEIQPPARSQQGASGIRIRIGSEKVTNMGDEADLVVAFNEQVLYGRIGQNAYKKGTIVLLENKWANHEQEDIKEAYAKSLTEFKELGFDVHEIPMEEECLKIVSNPQRGKNMWALGMLCYIYMRDINKAKGQIQHIFRKKSQQVLETNYRLLDSGFNWAKENLKFKFEVPERKDLPPQVVMNGNEAVGMGAIGAGFELCSMYPITPATSASHYLGEAFESAGGIIHQAEDEIAAIGFAVGASYAGKTALTITSGPGMSLKSEFIGLAVMAEVPLVIVNVQRGGPSTGLPTKVEQSDLWQAVSGQHGDNPKIVIAASTIEECFHFMIMARKLAEQFRVPVILLTDANLATGVQAFDRPVFNPEWLAAPLDQSPWKEGVPPFDWDEKTGLSQRPIPGQENGQYVLTGLAHTKESHVAYEPEANQHASNMRSRKLSTFQKTLNPPKIHGDEQGDLLIVGWGSTRGSIEEAVTMARAKGAKVSSIHLTFMSPFEPGLKDIFSKFKKFARLKSIMATKLNQEMEIITHESKRYSQLAWMLRAHTLVDIDYFSNVYGQPMNPGMIVDMISKELNLK